MEGRVTGPGVWRARRSAPRPLASTWSKSNPGGGIPEHDEGEAILWMGEDHLAPAGTFASIEPPVSRTILNRSDAPVTALLIGVQPEGGYEPMSWA
jgi:hypothetical protein